MSNNEQLAAFGQLSVEKCADLAQVELFGNIRFWAILRLITRGVGVVARNGLFNNCSFKK